MIKLKNILINSPFRRLIEQRGDEQQKKLNVLFVGDEETNMDSSYAKKILNSGLVTGEIVAKKDKDISTAKLRNLIISNISDTFDVVCIMDNAHDDKDTSVDQSISNLSDAYAEAKKFDAKLVVIANTSELDNSTEQSKIINKWITTVQTMSDDVIDLNNITSNTSYDKNGLIIPETQSRVAKEVLRILIRYIKDSKVVPDSESSENDYNWILLDLQSKLDVKTVFRSIGYGDANNLDWLASEEAWKQAENSYAVVYKIQMQLSKLKYSLGARGATGDYNKDTERAVRSFQEKNDLPTTGLLDLRTVALMFDKNAKPEDYIKDIKKSAEATQIDVDAEWLKITSKVIDEFEGGYWNRDIKSPADKICSNHPYDPMYANSGETLFGLDRRAGKMDQVKPAGEKFFALIDAEKARLGSDFCNVWYWGYRGGDKEEELKKLASSAMHYLYKQFSKAYLSKQALQIVESNKRLLFHFAYATWNGSGFFQDFANVVNKGVAEGKSVDELIDLSIAARTRRFGGTAWAKGNVKVIDVIKNDPELE
jgi:hypothetical protein